MSYSLNEYQQHANRTASALSGRDALAAFGLGVAGEAGEVADDVKKHLFHGHELDKAKLKKELGDVLWYVAAIATSNGLTLEEVAVANIEKLRKRYPDGFSAAASMARVDEGVAK